LLSTSTIARQDQKDDNNNESLGSPSFIIFTETIRKLAMTVAITSTFAFNKYNSETRPKRMTITMKVYR